jgi:hypothetical protein
MPCQIRALLAQLEIVIDGENHRRRQGSEQRLHQDACKPRQQNGDAAAHAEQCDHQAGKEEGHADQHQSDDSK